MNEQTMAIEPQTIAQNDDSSNISSGHQRKSIREKLTKLGSILRPNIFNLTVAFICFLVALVISQKLAISLLFGLGAYLISAFILRLFGGEKWVKSNGFFLFWKSKDNLHLIKTDSNSVVLQKLDKILIGIALLKVESLVAPVNLNPIWNFLQEEGILIQDCLEGCFLVIKKKGRLSRSKSMTESASKIIKELERAIIRTRRKFSLEFAYLNLRLVKDQEEIMNILNFGLSPLKFEVYREMSEEDLDSIRNSPLLPQNEQSNFSGVSDDRLIADDSSW